MIDLCFAVKQYVQEKERPLLRAKASMLLSFSQQEEEE